MPALYERAGLFWCAVLPNASQRNAVKLTLGQALHHDRNDSRSRLLSDGRDAIHSQKSASPVYGIGAGFDLQAALRQLNNHN
jgi:hypothetical protein